jgi:hypothetical protein
MQGVLPPQRTPPAIVSASYRTDIPAFYTPWLLARLAAGFCRVASPYGGTAYAVPLRPGAVAGFVFWTRNLGPLLPHLAGIAALAPAAVQFTLTGLIGRRRPAPAKKAWRAARGEKRRARQAASGGERPGAAEAR